MTRVALIGCGYVADFYARTLPLHPELELVCVADRDAQRASRFAAHYGYRGSTVDAVLRDPAIDLVANLTSVASHYQVTREALEAGKHVYSEKPLALDFGEARALVRLAAEKGRLLAGAPSNVLGESAQTAWRALRDGAVGTPRLVYAELDDGPIHLMRYREWRSASGAAWPWRDEFAIGAAAEHAGYHSTWLSAFFGPASRVTTFAARLVGKAPPATEVPDFGVACLEYPGGVVARLTCSIMAPRDHSMTIVGDAGTLLVRDCWDDASPVYLTRRTRLFERWEARPALARLLRRRVPPVRRPPRALHGRGGNRMDFARGLAEAAAAISEGRPCRLGAEFTLHNAEVALAMRDPAGMGSPRALETTFALPAPMPWATRQA